MYKLFSSPERPSLPGNIPLTTSIFLPNPSGAVCQCNQWFGCTSENRAKRQLSFSYTETAAVHIPQDKSIFPFSLLSALSTRFTHGDISNLKVRRANENIRIYHVTSSRWSLVHWKFRRIKLSRFPARQRKLLNDLQISGQA